jgi:hypothetical protein
MAKKEIGQPASYTDAIMNYYRKTDGGDLYDAYFSFRDNDERQKRKDKFNELLSATATLYARMVAGDGIMNILKEMSTKQGVFKDNDTTNSTGFESPCHIFK